MSEREWCPKCLDWFYNRKDIRSVYIYGCCAWCFDHHINEVGRCWVCNMGGVFKGKYCRTCAGEISIKIQNYD